jgi:hypothetical protein
MKGQQTPLRLTARGEAVRDALSVAAIAVGIASFTAILKMIGY